MQRCGLIFLTVDFLQKVAIYKNCQEGFSHQRILL